MRAAFTGRVVPLTVGPLDLELGIVDASHPGVAEQISRLLFRSIGDGRASLGGHLPDWLVADVERNYISPDKVRTLWAPFGHRFCAMRGDAIVATVHLTKHHDTIFTVDRHQLNVSAKDHPGFKPDRFHHMVNLSVLHELRRARIGVAMIDAIVTELRDLFDGDGLWVRADPPWHPGLDGLGFVHDPSRDLFLPESAERTAGLPHAALNARYACACAPATPFDPEALARRPERMQREKLQYLSFTRAFDAPRARSRPRPESTNGAGSVAADVALAVESGRTAREAVVLAPATLAGVASVLREASARRVPVVVRGREQSTARLARADRGLVLATEELTGIAIAEDGASVVVAGGTTWRDLVRTLAPRGVLPPVVPGWIGASVGGAIATGGIGRGSVHRGLVVDHVLATTIVTGDGRIVRTTRTQAAWLQEAALGGLGLVGVVAEVTLPLAPAPEEVAVFVAEVPHLAPALARVAEAEETWHATAFTQDGAWHVVQVVGMARGAPAGPALDGARCTARTPTLAFLETARPAPRGDSRFVHVAIAPASLDAWLDVVRSHPSVVGVQVLPIRSRGAARALVTVPDEPLVHAVLVTLGAGDDDLGEALLGAAEALGARSLLGGTLPDDEAGWAAHLGPRREAFELARSLADPAGVLAPAWWRGTGPRD